MALYIFPESAVSALAALERYRAWRERPVGEWKRFEVRRSAAEELVREVQRQGRTQMTPEESLRLIGHYGIPVAASTPVGSLEELKRVASGLPYPVVLKASAPELVHKMEAGGVAIDIRGPEELVAAAERMTDSVARHREKTASGEANLGFLIQEYVRGGREIIVGMTQDATYGPLVMFGLGGIYVETVKDVVFRAPPLTDLDAQEMIRQIRGYPLLEGVRGEAPVHLNALAEILQRFSQLVEELPELAEIEINPLLVFPEGKDFRAVDARVRMCGT
jgi:acyl-CoA synthetase (NDP forming)